MQHEIKTKGPLLTPDGTVSEAGYATSLIKEYDRKAIKANKLRIKEWDYYFIGNERYGVALTVADNGYMGLDSISLLDFQTGFQHMDIHQFPGLFQRNDVGVSDFVHNILQTVGMLNFLLLHLFALFPHGKLVGHCFPEFPVTGVTGVMA